MSPPPPRARVARGDFGRALLDHALANGQGRLVPQRVVDLELTGDGWPSSETGSD